MEPDLSKKRQSIFLEKDFSDILIKGDLESKDIVELMKRTFQFISDIRDYHACVYLRYGAA